MVPSPPSSTLLLIATPPSLLIGIDLLTFTTPATGTFLGIHSLPPGWHFVFASSTTSVSPRDGFWFYISPVNRDTKPVLLVREWDEATGSLQICQDEGKVKKVTDKLLTDKAKWEKSVTPYRQPLDPSPWPSLISHISLPVLRAFTASLSLNVSTTSCAPQDREPIPGLNNAEIDSALGERELGVLGIDLKRTWPEGAVGRERTEKARDRSWALEQVETGWWERWRSEEEQQPHHLQQDAEDRPPAPTTGADGDLTSPPFGALVLAYFQLSFLTLLLLQNWSCLQEWKRILGLVLTCKTTILERPSFLSEFLTVLKMQLERMDDVEGGLFDMLDSSNNEDSSIGAGGGDGRGAGGGNYLLSLLKDFRRTVDEISAEEDGAEEDKKNMAVKTIQEVEASLSSLEKWCTDNYGWDFSTSVTNSTDIRLNGARIVELEDGETVTLDVQRDLKVEEYEETGDWAPVIVEL